VAHTYIAQSQSHPQSPCSPRPAVGKRELWEQPFQVCVIDEENLRLRSETGWAEFGYLKMVAPKALVFRPPVKGNKDSENEIGPIGEALPFEQCFSRV